jgi:cysteine desulfurase
MRSCSPAAAAKRTIWPSRVHSLRLTAKGGLHVITSAIEHPAVLAPCRFLERLGAAVTYLPVDGTGRVDPEDVRRAITPQTILISIMHANNEVGTIQPIEDISLIARERGIRLHTDAAQSVGKIPAKVDKLGFDLLTIAGHKLYAPKGVALCATRSRAGAFDPRRRS